MVALYSFWKSYSVTMIVAVKQIGEHSISAVWKTLKQRTNYNLEFSDIICMTASAGTKAVFFSFLTEAGLSPRLFILLTPKLFRIILVISSSDGAFYRFDFFFSLLTIRGHKI